VLVTAPLYVLSNLAADLLIACLDPRVRAHV
jgi:ABC-type dipeptide/oligopeptide/nickel transport system permease component